MATRRWQLSLFYLDDMFMSKSPSGHVMNVRQVIHILLNAIVTTKVQNVFFTYLQYWICIAHNSPYKSVNCSIHFWCSTPLERGNEGDDLWSVLGLCTALYRFIPNSACIANPVVIKLWNNQPHPYKYLNDEERDTLTTRWDCLIPPPIFALLCSKGEYIIRTDACDRQVGAVLLQCQLDTAETNWLLVKIAHIYQKVVPYPQGWMPDCGSHTLANGPLPWYIYRFMVCWDHFTLRWIWNLADETGNIVRKRLRLS